MAKVNFNARKDPLLRPRRTTEPAGQTAPTTAKTPLTDAGRKRAPARTDAPQPRRAGPVAVEEPAGVIAITPPEAEKRPRASTRATGSSDAPTQLRTATRPAPARPGPRRGVQTSIALPPDVWDTLDELSAGAAGRLLTAILSANLPDTPTAALATVEALLRDGPADVTLHEERNYRLPYDLRTRLDELATALGGGRRPQRSLLMRAIVAAHAPSSAEQARELITTQRIDALRAGLHASTD